MPVPDPGMMTRPVYRWDTERGFQVVRLRKELLSVPVAEGFHRSRYASVYVLEREANEKENINEEVREGRAFVPEIPGMFNYYCGPCMIVKEGI